MKRKAEAEAVQEGTDAQEEEEVKQKLHQFPPAIAQSIFSHLICSSSFPRVCWGNLHNRQKEGSSGRRR